MKSLLLTTYDADIIGGAAHIKVGNILICVPTPSGVEDWGPSLTAMCWTTEEGIPFAAVRPLVREIAVAEGWGWCVRRCDEHAAEEEAEAEAFNARMEAK